MNALVLSEPTMPPRFASDPDPEVPAKARRRRFTASYKLRILEEAEQCTQPGEVGALLRREGLYSSLLSRWRQQREAGAEGALTPKKRGRKPQPVEPQACRVAELERENARLRDRLEKAQTTSRSKKTLPATGERPGKGVLMPAATTLAPKVGVQAACSALGLPRARPPRSGQRDVPSTQKVRH